MAQEIIDIGSAPNDGNGDPLRAAFYKTKNNFSELYSTYATTTYVTNQINSLINSAPGTLDTLGEIATALSNENDIVNALITTVSGKANTANLSNVAFTGDYDDLLNKPTLTTGYTGSIGFSGSQGTTGFTGSVGDIGYTGSIGFSGSQGDTGYTGSIGDIGYTGSIGDIGYTGSIGFTGSTGISTNTTITVALGSPSDTQFSIAMDNNYIYYCTGNYDGSTNVWKRVAFSMDTW